LGDLEGLASVPVDEIIVGKAFYEGLLTLEQLGGWSCLQRG
jgi:phosphoribosylformimino-5-aminoimidazole carboxamide ribonucleotide (ProFAR) isomerase